MLCIDEIEYSAHNFRQTVIQNPFLAPFYYTLLKYVREPGHGANVPNAINIPALSFFENNTFQAAGYISS
jgi:hypothetical protein